MNRLVSATALLGILALGAARTNVATIPSGTTPRYAASASNGALVIVASGSNNTLNVIDGRSFTKLASSLVLSSGGTAVKSITVGTDTTPDLAVGTKNGKAEQWRVVDVLDFADDFPNPTPRVFALPSPLPTGTPGPVTGVAIGSLGARLYAADSANKSVVAFDDSSTTAVSGHIALGHTPLSALDVNTGFFDRIFFGTDDGNIAYIDASTLSLSVFSLDVTQTHDYPALASGTFSGGLVRLVTIDTTSNTVYLIDPAGPTVVTSKVLTSHPVAIAISGSPASTIWIAEDSSGGGVNQVEAFDGALASVQTAVPLAASPLSLTEAGGYLMAGLSDGNLAVITDRPWLDITSVSPNPVASASTSVKITFTSTEAGTASIFVNGGGVGSGTTVSANTPTTVTITPAQLDGRLFEGSNRLRVQLAGSTSGQTGHDEASLKLDLPPPTPSGFSVGFGDGRVIATWDSINIFDAPDFKDYVVRFGTSAAGTNGVIGQASPAITTGTTYAVLVSNGTTVFMSVMSRDSAGNLSPATAVLSATAQPTSGAAELSGDNGGFLFSCGIGRLGAGARGLASILGAGVAMLALRGFFRRRSRYPADMVSGDSK